MKAGIISAGHNFRLQNINKPKGLLKLGGKTLIERKIYELEHLKFKEVYCVIREDVPELEEYLLKLNTSLDIVIIKYNSPSPLDSTLILGEYLRPDEGILTFNVDALYNTEDLRRFKQLSEESHYLKSKDMIMWASKIVPVVNDDPAFMSLDSKDRVLSYGKDIEETPLVFGQIRYCSSRILHLKAKLLSQGITKMRYFIKHLIDNEFSVFAYRTNHPTYDLDTPLDLENIKKILENEKIFSEN